MDRYAARLERGIREVAGGHARTRQPLSHRPELRFARVEHHFVFVLDRIDRVPLVLAVLHENMDLMVRLRDRLGYLDDAT